MKHIWLLNNRIIHLIKIFLLEHKKLLIEESEKILDIRWTCWLVCCEFTMGSERYYLFITYIKNYFKISVAKQEKIKRKKETKEGI
jgi:hypothetical protein